MTGRHVNSARTRIRAGWLAALVIGIGGALLIGGTGFDVVAGTLVVAWFPLLVTRLVPARRRAHRRLAATAAVAVFGALAVVVRSSVYGPFVTLAGSLVAAALVGGALAVGLARASLRDARRRHRYPAGAPGLWHTASVLVMSGAALATMAFDGGEVAVEFARPAPVTRVLFWALDGLDANDLATYIASRPRSVLGKIVEGGTSAYLGWEPHPRRRGWDEFWAPGGEIAPPAPSALDRARRRHWPLGTRRPPAGPPATVIDVLERGGRPVTRIGWWAGLGARAEESISVPEGSWSALRRAGGADPGLPRLPLADGVTVDDLRAFEPWGRLPSEDWRSGGRATPNDERIFETARIVGADPVRWWDDRFRARVAAETARRGRGALEMTYFEYPLHIEGSLGDDPIRLRGRADAVNAFLDAFDAELAVYRATWRAGDVFVLMATPPPLNGMSAPGTVILLGEKVKPAHSLTGHLPPEEIRNTILYLLGAPLSEAWGTSITWDALLDGLGGRRPARTVSSYPRNRTPPTGRN